jgi:glycosyltransferase involved in cell wall biosynthesis
MNKHRLCYITRNYRGVASSGNKAKTDNENTMQSMGAHNLGLHRTFYDNTIITFFLDLMGIIKMMFTVRKGDIVVLQYPVKKYFSFICRNAHLHGAKVIALIHDLGSFRRKKLTVAHEISRLSNADYVIASNDVMQQWLKDNGYKNKLGALGLFDYLSSSESKSETSMPSQFTLVYAGALAMRKNAFLLEMAEHISNYHVLVYGNKDGLPGIKDNAHLRFHDFEKPDDFIKDVAGDFGFVWDGDSTETCKGNFGEYLRYNSPHKVSFYLRAGLPIIIWRQAAVASIIEREGIGICIDSIDQLNDILPQITPEQMQQMRDNVKRVSQKLKTGTFFNDAVTKAINELNEED